MSERQRRYLFRILAQQGITGESAHQFLKDHFQRESLQSVTKTEAAMLIDQLLHESSTEGKGE